MKNPQQLIFAIAVILIAFQANLFAQERTNPKSQQEELGAVSWFRNYNFATKEAKRQNKSVLIFFQEVPGCSTCKNYGNNVMSHPLIVEAIENEFIPLVIFNNKGGDDRNTLNKFNEPTWNNPVVRIVNSEGSDVVDRLAGDYSPTGLVKSMKKALVKDRKSIPEYLNLLEEELSAGFQTQESYYKMYCFWSGEKHFGAKNGVMKTEAGFMGGHEVVKVTYDKKKLNESELTDYAKKASCNPIENNGKFRASAKDYHFYLQQTNYKYLPLSELQKTKINAALGSKQHATKYLSPKQLQWLKDLEKSNSKKPVLLEKDIVSAWEISNNE